jgi:hypothetical protein
MTIGWMITGLHFIARNEKLNTLRPSELPLMAVGHQYHRKTDILDKI